MYNRAKKFVVFCSVALHYRIQRTFLHNCITVTIFNKKTLWLHFNQTFSSDFIDTEQDLKCLSAI